MKKNFVIVLLLLVCTICLAMGLTACDEESDINSNDIKQDTEQTGDEGQENDTAQNADNSNDNDADTDTETHIHNYTFEVTRKTTCTELGILTYTCIICGDCFTINEDPFGHSPIESTENNVTATCTEEGSYDSVVCCSVCGEELSRETITVTKIAHTYNGYLYDSNGHWQVCSVCNTTSESESHLLNNSICTICGFSISETYSVTLLNVNKKPLSNVLVELYNSSGTKVGSSITDNEGDASFSNLFSGRYTAIIDESTLPAIDYLESNQVVLTEDSKNVTVTANTKIITDEAMPTDKIYNIGDTIYDFTVQCYNTDGSQYEVNLLEYLENYSVVILNFYYRCSPCISEVPFMQQAYEEYAEKVGLIAFDYTGMGDTLTQTINFKSTYGLTFDFTLDSTGYYRNYGITAFPTTVIIDRYGIIAEIIIGSNTSVTSWINIFEYYTNDNYTPFNESSPDYDYSDNSEMPYSEDIVNTIVTMNELTDSSTFTFKNYDNVENYPWAIGVEDIDSVNSYIKTSNVGVGGSCSVIVIDVSLLIGQAVLFDYFVSTEDDYDIFYVQVDGVLQFETSGLSSNWQTCLAYVALYPGDYQIMLCYQKDSSKNINNDEVYVYNLRIEDSSTIASSSSYSADILYNAANNYADSSVDVSNYGEGYGYYNYVDVYLASDEYYHIGCKTDGSDPDDDPYLLADLCNGTPWYSILSIKDEVYWLADEIDKQFGDGSYDAFEYYIELQDYCGYVPVNAELHDLLVAFVSYYGRVTGDLLDEQWLEFCKYYVHYGADHEICYSVDNLAESYFT